MARPWIGVFIGLMLGACTEAPSSLGPVPSAGVGPLCQLGCVETDPNPNAPGVFLGSGVSPDARFFGDHTDADRDRLSDFCEKNLALAFAPELFYWSADNVGREPYWVARGDIETEKVVIGYLLSYYRDEGSPSHACDFPPPFYPPSCDGHSRNPPHEYYGSARQECYWTIVRFRGWIPITIGGDDSDPYSPLLAFMGF
ncbi:MAG TPA: hypothetical protein VNI61_08405 [Gemmatimonadales bacterium]|nr:hypothetical protein [Gemmatimonadales bacterium]